jgi:hypothetical protein
MSLQKEDIMSEEAIKEGYRNRSFFQNVNEEFCTDEERMIYRLTTTSFAEKLGDFLSQAYELKEKLGHCPQQTSSFEPPKRTVVAQEKKDQWINSLSEGDSFQSLAKLIPHGLKEGVLLDSLSKKQIPSPRADWSIKVIGCDELRVAGQIDYSLKWTQTLTKHLGEKLRELSKESVEEKRNALKV